MKSGDFFFERIDFGELGFCFFLMGTACAQYPIEVTAHFQEKCKVMLEGIWIFCPFTQVFLIEKIKVSEKMEKEKKYQDGWVCLKPFHKVI